MIGKIASGKLLPNVCKLLCNAGKLLSTSQQPTPESFAKFQQLVEYLIKHIHIKPELTESLYLNHICMFSPNPKRKLAFADFRLGEPLILSQFKNYLKYCLRLACCPTVVSVEFHDVLSTFYKIEGSFNSFFFQYPNILRVGFEVRAPTEKMAQLLLEFLGKCRGLVSLDLELSSIITGFDENFYAELAQIPSLCTLGTLFLFEYSPIAWRPIDFDSLFAAFKYLRIFHTNMMARENVPDLLDKIRIRSRFKFYYDHRWWKDTAVEVEVRRFDCRLPEVKEEYEVTLTERLRSNEVKEVSIPKPNLEAAKGIVRSYLENAR